MKVGLLELSVDRLHVSVIRTPFYVIILRAQQLGIYESS